MNGNTPVKKILILAANPKRTSRLRLDEEVREIADGLKRAQKRDQFILEQRWAVRPRDIQRAMLDISPQLVHFSGHGTGDEGLMFEDETGAAQLVDGEALAGLFALFTQVECVVLNGCYSKFQADAIAEHIPYVIGMNQAIGDKAAIEFAVGFYDGLGAGYSVEFAYNLGCNAIRLAGITEYLTPVLNKSPKLSASAQDILPQSNKLSSWQRRHLEQERYNLEQQSDLLTEKLRRLTNALIIETDEAVCFKLEKQIEQMQLKYDLLGKQLDMIDNKLQ